MMESGRCWADRPVPRAAFQAGRRLGRAARRLPRLLHVLLLRLVFGLIVVCLVYVIGSLGVEFLQGPAEGVDQLFGYIIGSFLCLVALGILRAGWWMVCLPLGATDAPPRTAPKPPRGR